MFTVSKDIKLLTLSLVLRTMPKDQQALLMSHFNPEVVKRLVQIEKETGSDVEKLDWTPFYQSWPELQKILNECREEIKVQKLYKFADEQRPKLREYILTKLGKQKKGPPVFLSKDITKLVDEFILEQKGKIQTGM
ncbi:MAG: hypothetical protein HYY52_08225 [Candidatus Melainabacteria bacterium]|nr:hypothetical protein [Candidatus Melainabacteria bacterium]